MEKLIGKTKENEKEEIEKRKEDKQTEKIEKDQEEKGRKGKKKKPFMILGFNIWRLMGYFIIYSIAGFLIETAFGALTKGVIESRKSFLYGPFCGIYGIGAVIMILFLQYFRKNNYTLFFGGFVIGSIVEYFVSLFGEMMLDVKWWDYSSVPLNLGGRICVFFSLFWGILAIYLMSHLNPKVDNLIEKMKQKLKRNTKVIRGVTLAVTILLFIDCVLTGFALKMFYVRLTTEYNLDLQGVDKYLAKYEELYQKPEIKKVVDKYWNDKVMLKTFPNLKVMAKDGTMIYVSDVLKDIQPYYVRIFTPRVPGAVIEGS